MPEFSIIIPAFNEEDLLKNTLNAIRSAMSNVALDGEIIVVDNNSTDKTADIAQKLADICIFEPHNQISRARNLGAKAANSQFLIFIDADSIPGPGLLNSTLKNLSSDKIAGGGCRLELDGLVNNRTTRFIINFWGRISVNLKLAAGSYIFCRRDAFESFGGFDEKLYAAEDVFFSKRLKKWARKNKKQFIILDEILKTSSRKMQWYSTWSIARQCLMVAFFPFLLRKRRFLNLWYKRPSK